MLMRSQSKGDLRRQISALEQSGELRHTQSQQRHVDDTLEPVPYFIVPALAARKIGSLVIPYVHINRRGFLDVDSPKAYGITETPTESVAEHGEVRLREAHVLAEDLALRRGLYTPFGRSAAELYVAEHVAEPVNAYSYVPDRMAHLSALANKIQTEKQFEGTQLIVDQIKLGVDGLQNYLESL